MTLQQLIINFKPEGVKTREQARPMDIAQGEKVEKELDAMIERRPRQKDPEEASEAWQESVRRYNVRRREENRLLWCDYFSHLAGSLRTRAEEYDRRAQALVETDQPKGAA